MLRSAFASRLHLLLLMLLALPGPAAAQAIDLQRPGEREFIVDRAGLIEASDEQTIRQMCDALLTDTGIPIIVVTIDSMEAHSRHGEIRIETFAHLLFDQWGIGHVEIDGRPSNLGMLLVVSRGDRKARIQLGAGWGRDHDAAAQVIMDTIIIPPFKRGDFSQGIVNGTEAMAEMARGGPDQAPPVAASSRSLLDQLDFDACPVSWCGVVAIIIIAVLGRVLNGVTGGWFGMSSGGGWSSGGGGFSGGSFGGGFSGGGGASGSW